MNKSLMEKMSIGMSLFEHDGMNSSIRFEPNQAGKLKIRLGIALESILT